VPAPALDHHSPTRQLRRDSHSSQPERTYMAGPEELGGLREELVAHNVLDCSLSLRKTVCRVVSCRALHVNRLGAADSGRWCGTLAAASSARCLAHHGSICLRLFTLKASLRSPFFVGSSLDIQCSATIDCGLIQRHDTTNDTHTTPTARPTTRTTRTRTTNDTTRTRPTA
jgi:hypothetical protein